MNFLLYWTPPYAREAVRERYVLRTLGSYHLKRVAVGDVVWIASATHGRLRLIGRIRVHTLTSSPEGPRARAAPGRGERMREVLIPFPAVAALRFANTVHDRLEVGDGCVFPQQLQTMRALSAHSAHLLRRLWERPAL